ncbi:hypothetical protein EVAR_14678_1 [Eumeta japonica]|uniref:Uncharacterized protein n=1 Tax=Eumeta variegata TaxID=151549 RepID=A0A4C1U2C0_EUMVA|nr:hypothetical protein EVAR_14678_1 [Eumeta japonica]
MKKKTAAKTDFDRTWKRTEAKILMRARKCGKKRNKDDKCLIHLKCKHIQRLERLLLNETQKRFTKERTLVRERQGGLLKEPSAKVRIRNLCKFGKCKSALLTRELQKNKSSDKKKTNRLKK